VAALLLPRPLLADGIGPIRPIRPIQPGVGQGPRIVIEVDPKARVARLIVPRQFLNNAPVKPPRRFGQLPTIMIGVALAMSLAFSGLWLVRKRGVPGVKPLLLVVALLGIGGGALWADIAPRPPFRPQPGQPPVLPGLQGNQVIAAFQPVQVETPAQGNVIKLIIPAQQGGGVGGPGRPAQPFGQGGGFE
jgi:hypothetical protein